MQWSIQLLRYRPNLLSHLNDLLTTVSTYLPQVLAQTLFATPKTETIVLPLEGTLLFADIDGFTALTERFSKITSEAGAEEITSVVNQFLDILIKTTTPYGGDLQKFGGDAGLLLFTGAHHAEQAAAAALAVQHAMQEKMDVVETSLGTFPLKIAIGLSSGKLLGLGLGTKQDRNWLLLGDPLHSVGRAQRAAPPGGIVIDQETCRCCEETIACVPLADGLYQVEMQQSFPPESPENPLATLPQTLESQEQFQWVLNRLDALTPYLDPELLDRIAALPTPDRFELWSERRQVTILMLTPPDASDLIAYRDNIGELKKAIEAPNATFVRVRDMVQRYDGVVNKIGLGPHGPYLVVLFGAPKAHEDDPLRAVLAALEVQERIEAPLQIGINTGFVFAGDVGTDARREYTVIGDAVNLAYRLMTHCDPGSIWLGPNTAHHSSVTARVTLTPGPSQQLKGKEKPVIPHIAQGTRATLSIEEAEMLPLVGRERELTALEDALANVVTKQTARIVLLHGPAGSGKSRLAYDFSEETRAQGDTIYLGTAPSYGGHLPYAAWERPLRTMLGIDEVSSSEGQRAALRQILAQYDQEMWTALVAPLLGLDIRPSPEVEALPPDLHEKQRQAVLHILLTAQAQQHPLILVLENAHWMPASSLRLVNGLMQSPVEGAFFLIVTYRDEPSFLETWQPPEEAIDLPLTPLSNRAMGTLAQHAAGERKLPREVKHWIIKRGEGSPLFAIEAVRALQTAGLLTPSNGDWVLSHSLDEAPLPDSTYGLIQSRIDQLEPPSRHLLRAATVVGEQMTVPMLVAGYGEEPRPLVERRLPGLAQMGLVYSEYAEDILLFRQPLVREVAYRGLPHRIRRLVHCNLSRYLDQRREQATSNWLTLLAHHAFEGQLWEVALRANLDLGERLLENFMTEQAVQALEQALHAAQANTRPRHTQQLTIHKYLGKAYTILGRYKIALQHLKAARDLLPWPLDQKRDIEHSVDLDYRMALIWKSQGEIEKAFDAIEKGLNHQAIHQTITHAHLQLLGAGIHYRQGNYQQTWTWSKQAVEISERIQHEETPKIKARGLYLMALVHYKEGKLQAALELGKNSLQIYQKTHDLLGEVDARTNLLIINWLLGEWAAAADHGESALRIARRIRYTIGEMRVAGNLGEIYRYQGHLDKAREAYNTVLKIVQERGIAYGEAVMENNLAAVAIKESAWQEAKDRLQKAENILKKMGKGTMFPELYRHHGQIALSEGKFEQALENARHCLELTQERADRQEMGRAHEFLSKVYLALDQPEEANEHIREALNLLEEAEDRYGLAQAQITQAELYWKQGKKMQARQKIKTARQHLEHLEANLDLRRIAELQRTWRIENDAPY